MSTEKRSLNAVELERVGGSVSGYKDKIQNGTMTVNDWYQINCIVAAPSSVKISQESIYFKFFEETISKCEDSQRERYFKMMMLADAKYFSDKNGLWRQAQLSNSLLRYMADNGFNNMKKSKDIEENMRRFRVCEEKPPAFLLEGLRILYEVRKNIDASYFTATNPQRNFNYGSGVKFNIDGFDGFIAPDSFLTMEINEIDRVLMISEDEFLLDKSHLITFGDGRHGGTSVSVN